MFPQKGGPLGRLFMKIFTKCEAETVTFSFGEGSGAFGPQVPVR
jgi:hypothetical protein